MRKKILLFLSLVMLWGMSGQASAEFAPMFYNFEDYTGTGGAPSGWSTGGAGSVLPEVLDEEHGTSMKIVEAGSGQSGRYLRFSSLPETVSEGRFLVSFEVYFKEPLGTRLRLHLYSPTSGKEDHSIFYFQQEGNYQEADTGTGKWSFVNVAKYEPGRWYQVDILFDMDKKVVYHYLDGKNVSQKPISFQDFSRMDFRTDAVGSDAPAELYMDNVSFKYLTQASIELKESTVKEGNDIIELSFSDLIDKQSLNDMKVYKMGTNPVSLEREEVGFELLEANLKKARIKLQGPLAAVTTYMVSMPSAKTAFGDEYTNKEAYARTGGAAVWASVVNSNFANATGAGIMAAVNAGADDSWDRTGRARGVYPQTLTNDVVPKAIYFQPHGGIPAYPNNELSISKTYDTAFSGEKNLEFMMKTIAGNQFFTIYDSEGASITPVTVEDCDIKAGGQTKTGVTDWFTVNIIADLDEGTADVLVDDVVLAEDVDISAISDIKTVEFAQVNSASAASIEEAALMSSEVEEPDEIVLEEAEEPEEFAEDTEETEEPALVEAEPMQVMAVEEIVPYTAAANAESYLAYFSVQNQREGVGVSVVSFEDVYGNVSYPEGKISSDIEKINIKFSDAVDADTLDGNILLLLDGDEESFTGVYNAEARTYTITLPEYFAGAETYELIISDDVLDSTGAGIVPASGSLLTKAGFFKARSLAIEGDAAVTVSTTITHTDASCPTVYLIYTAYKGNLMVDMQFVEIDPNADKRNIDVTSPAYTKPADADSVKAFLWDGFNTKIPLIRAEG